MTKMTEKELVVEECSAIMIDSFICKVLVPLFCDKNGTQDHLGTGLFLNVDDKIVLLTARHIFENCPAKCVAFPASSGGGCLQTLGCCTMHSAGDVSGSDIDIAAINLTQPEVLKIIKDNWESISIENLGIADAGRHFLVTGFPSQMIGNKGGSDFKGRPLGIWTNSIQAPQCAKQPVNPTLDIFLNFSKNGKDPFSGKDFEFPEIQGMSGGAIWQICSEFSGNVWSGSEIMRLVGIQSSVLPGRYLRGKSQAYIMAILKKIIEGENTTQSA